MNENSIAKAREAISKRMFSVEGQEDMRIREALREFETVPLEWQFLIAASDVEFADLVRANLPPSTISDPLARRLTAIERANIETDVLIEKMGIGEMAVPPDPYDWQRARGFYSKPVDHVQIAEDILAMTEMVVHDPDTTAILGISGPTESRSCSSKGKFLRDLAEFAAETDPASPLSMFLKAFASEDEIGMRKSIRPIV